MNSKWRSLPRAARKVPAEEHAKLAHEFRLLAEPCSAAVMETACRPEALLLGGRGKER